MFFIVGGACPVNRTSSSRLSQFKVKSWFPSGDAGGIEYDSFRRTFISELFDAGVDISTIQQLARHSNANQTTRYDRRGDETKRRAVQKLSIPKK
ncbi:hypothetical protein CDG79_20620 [Nostoc sp. 'Peltigera membranacea cyanobiont' 232]|nr:hypothetical protein CDG79_20620 [Nostoc sp. 'Peltigera membranacea cyanobiont' 232]